MDVLPLRTKAWPGEAPEKKRPEKKCMKKSNVEAVAQNAQPLLAKAGSAWRGPESIAGKVLEWTPATDQRKFFWSLRRGSSNSESLMQVHGEAFCRGLPFFFRNSTIGSPLGDNPDPSHVLSVSSGPLSCTNHACLRAMCSPKKREADRQQPRIA